MRPSFCSQCGTKLGETARFCPGCGRPIEVGEAPADEPVPPVPNRVQETRPSSSRGAELTVCAEGIGTHRTIQSALDDVAEGGRIVVRPGRYRESIVFRRNCTVTGTLPEIGDFEPLVGEQSVLMPSGPSTIDLAVGGTVEGLAILGSVKNAAIKGSHRSASCVRNCIVAVPEGSAGLADEEPFEPEKIEVERCIIVGPGKSMWLGGPSMISRCWIYGADRAFAHLAMISNTTIEVPSPTNIFSELAKAIFGPEFPSISERFRGDARVPATTQFNLYDSQLSSCMVGDIAFEVDGKGNRITGGHITDFSLSREPITVLEGAALALEDVEFGSGRSTSLPRIDCAVHVQPRGSLSGVGVRITCFRAGIKAERLSVVRLERCEISYCKVGIDADRSADVKTVGVRKPLFGASF